MLTFCSDGAQIQRFELHGVKTTMEGVTFVDTVRLGNPGRSPDATTPGTTQRILPSLLFSSLLMRLLSGYS